MRSFIPDAAHAGAAADALFLLPQAGGSYVKAMTKPLSFDCFSTDHCGFVVGATAKAKMQTEFKLIVKQNGTTIVEPATGRTTISPTSKVSCGLAQWR